MTTTTRPIPADDDFDVWADDDWADEDYDGQAVVAGLWDKYSPRKDLGFYSTRLIYGYEDERIKDVERLAAARRIVQGFVRTFATDKIGYTVVFDEKVKTAGTDLEGRKVLISHRPLFDETLTEPEAQNVLTAMAVHECSHVRYGKATAAAVRSEFRHHINEGVAHTISNVLDDVRIEREFARDYPGYRHVFAPALAYVARSEQEHSGGIVFSVREPVTLMVAATRYDAHVTWPEDEEIQAERAYWKDWAQRYTVNGKVALHLAGVYEALAHMASPDPDPEDEPPTCGPMGPAGDEDGEDRSSDNGPTGEGNEGGDEGGDGSQSDGKGQKSDKDRSLESAINDQQDLPACVADAIDDAARHNGARPSYSAHDAEQFIREAEQVTTVVEDGHASSGQIMWSPRGMRKVMY